MTPGDDPTPAYKAHDRIKSRTPEQRAAEKAALRKAVTDAMDRSNDPAKPFDPNAEKKREPDNFGKPPARFPLTEKDEGLTLDERAPEIVLQMWYNGIVTYRSVKSGRAG